MKEMFGARLVRPGLVVPTALFESCPSGVDRPALTAKDGTMNGFWRNPAGYCFVLNAFLPGPVARLS